MSEHPRYEILKPIAHGDFATVFHGFDRELEREVAIKQIHPQFLDEPKKLDRYWKEAQLLAGLEHPYIMTIYDIVRDRGWLILELMQGSLQQKLSGRPIDLEDLRLTIIYMCHALGFLHKNGIIHGDVKPSNLLLDKNHRVKLGDFGIARRLVSDDGSVIKGTTKYMAPEVVSDQFGPVGHHSDLYSLGFASYELMCGEHFEKLFPGLHMAGRDPQISWMMWHGAKDRQVPDIQKVLEGVPEDLTRVIHKLCNKVPEERYLGASEVIFDLKMHSEGKDPEELKQQQAAEEAEANKRQKKYRLAAYGVVVLSLFLSLGLLFIDTGNSPGEAAFEYPRAGVIEEIQTERKTLGVNVAGSETLEGLELSKEVNEIFLNDRRVKFSDLAIGDQIEVKRVTSDEGTYFVVNATRQTRTEFVGTVEAIDINNGLLTIRGTSKELGLFFPSKQVGDKVSENQGDRLVVPIVADLANASAFEVYVPSDLEIAYNGRTTWDGKAFQVGDFRIGDRVAGEFVDEEQRSIVQRIFTARQERLAGTLQSVNRDRGTLTLLVNDGGKTIPRTLWLDPNCSIGLNGVETLSNGQQISLNDLRSGDDLQLVLDDLIRSVNAQREMLSTGVVASINPIERTISVSLDSPDRLVRFQLNDETQIGLLSDGQERTLAYLRIGDRVEIEHDSPDFVDPNANVVAVDPVPNRDSYAILISYNKFDDSQISPIGMAEIDCSVIEESLRQRYRIPDAQIVSIENATQLALVAELKGALQAIPANSQILVYLKSRGYQVQDEQPVFAVKETRFSERVTTGMRLQELLDLLEGVESRETILLLDVAHPGSGEDTAVQLDSETFALQSKPSPAHPLSATVDVLVSCREGEVNQASRNRMGSVFAETIAEAFAGTADENRDWIVDTSELAEYALQSFEDLTFQQRIEQHPLLIAADPKPVRLLPESKEAVLTVLAHLEDGRYEPSTQTDFNIASELQPEQPDAWIAYALVSLNHHRTAEAKDLFQQVSLAHPAETLPHLLLAWQNLVAKDYETGIRNLSASMGTIDEQDADSQELIDLAKMMGQMEAFCRLTPEQPLSDATFEKLDEQIEKLPEALRSELNKSSAQAEAKLSRLEAEIEEAKSTSAKTRLTRQFRQLSTVCELDFEQLGNYAKAQLDR